MHPGHSLLCRSVGCFQYTFPTVMFLLRYRTAVNVLWSHTLVPLVKYHPTTLPGRMSSALEKEELNLLVPFFGSASCKAFLSPPVSKHFLR